MNQIGFQPSFKSNVVLAGYHSYTQEQKDLVNQSAFVKAFDKLQANGNHDTVCLMPAEDDSEALKMVITENDKGVSMSDMNWLYKNDNYKTILAKYNQSRSFIDAEKAGENPYGLSVEKAGKLAAYIA